MPLADKTIVVTPRTSVGSPLNADPNIRFTAAGGSPDVPLTIRLFARPINNGTLSFEASNGQLFSITNDFTGTIFSVNDVSGIPSIEVNADGTVAIAEFGGNVGIGTGSPVNKVHILGDLGVQFDSSGGSPEYKAVLSHNGTDFNILGLPKTSNINFSATTGYVFQNASGNQVVWDMPNNTYTFNGSLEVIAQSDHGPSWFSGGAMIWAKSRSFGEELLYTTGDNTGIDHTLQNIQTSVWYFDNSTTAADPGAGDIRFNSATPASVTNLYIDDLESTGKDASYLLSNLADGDILKIRDSYDATDYLVVSVNGTPTDNTGWWTVPVTVIHSGGLPIATNPLHIDVEWSGSQSSGITGTVANDQVVTGTGASTVDSSANLTFNGSTLAVTGNVTATTSSTFSGGIAMSNANITGVGALSFNDPGPGEGISWTGGNWSIYDSPDDLVTNTAGNLQFVTSGTRMMTVGTDGIIDINKEILIGVDATQPWITVDSTSSGDNWSAQGAGISVGESGKKGSAAIHLTYNGDGSGYLGMGTVDDTAGTGGRPTYGHLDFTYNTSSILVGGLLYPGNSAGTTGSSLVQSVAYIESADSQNYGSINVTGAAGSSGTYSGYSINRRVVFMNNNSTTSGFYDDTNNEWHMTMIQNGALNFYNNGVAEAATQDSNAAGNTSGITVNDHAQVSRDVGFNDLRLVNDNPASVAVVEENMGGVIYADDNTGFTITLPSSTSSFPVGGVITIINANTSVALTVADQASYTCFYLDGSTRTDIAGTASIAAGGVATIWRQTTGGTAAERTFLMWGSGITA